MNSANLSAIFQPGLLSHPSHDMAPPEYRLSQDVLIFLIENQDNFLIGMSGTAADEKTVNEVSGGAPPLPASSSAKNIGRSASNASAGADSLRKLGGLRKNASVSSRNSKASSNVPSPVTPSSGIPYASNNSGGVHRSNTLPPKRSPGIGSTRFTKPSEPSTPTSAGLTPPSAGSGFRAPLSSTPSNVATPVAASTTSPAVSQAIDYAAAGASVPVKDTTDSPDSHPATALLPRGPDAISTPTRDRKTSGLFTKQSTPDSDRKDTKHPNKLKKKPPGSAIPSAHSSTHSLHAGDSPQTNQFYTPMATPAAPMQTERQMEVDPLASAAPLVANTSATPTEEDSGTPHVNTNGGLGIEPQRAQPSSGTLAPQKSPVHSTHSRSSFTDVSDFDQLDDPVVKAEKQEKREKKRRWRFSAQTKKHADSTQNAGHHPVHQKNEANYSASSVASSRPRKSFTTDAQLGSDQSTTGHVPGLPLHGTDPDMARDLALEHEKKGFLGRLKAKISKSGEAEKERGKSPTRTDPEHQLPTQSLSAAVHEPVPYRGRSMEAPSEQKEAGLAKPVEGYETARPHPERPSQVAAATQSKVNPSTTAEQSSVPPSTQP